MDKNDLRKFYTQLRNGINSSDKIKADNSIFSFFINSRFSNRSLFLCYVSYKSEVDTHNIIRFLLDIKKRVAVPVCKGGSMHFCEIYSFDELKPEAFGILAPELNENNTVTDFSDALCLVPALSFDCSGNRLGYGGGYYDRFLKEYNIQTLGLAYSKCLCEKIPAESFDVKINAVLTENGFRNLKTGEDTYE